MQPLHLVPVLLLSVACGSSPKKHHPDSPSAGPSSASAPGDDGSATTREGFLFRYEDGDFKLCETMCESYPPQCCGDSIELGGLGSANLESVLPPRSDTNLRWSDASVSCTGTLRDNRMQVTAVNGQAVQDQAPATSTLGLTCSDDSDCSDGLRCDIVQDCDMCDGGPMQCVDY